MKKKFLLLLMIFSFVCLGSLILYPHNVWAGCYSCGVCDGKRECGNSCSQISFNQKNKTNKEISDRFISHKQFIIDMFFKEHLLPAMKLMTEQITVTAMQQVQIIGSFMDAKHQLETQRLFQQLQARAHKDYHPSEGVCTFGTNTRSLARSERAAEFTTAVLSKRELDRQMLSASSLSSNGAVSDQRSRLDQYRRVFCNKADNGGGLQYLCASSNPDPRQVNADIDFTRTVDLPLTLKLNFTPEGNSDHNARGVSSDEENIFALSNNLYAHSILDSAIPNLFLEEVNQASGVAKVTKVAAAYSDFRSNVAKTSAARNSFLTLAGMKAEGSEDVQPYLYAILNELGMSPEIVSETLGEKPSYFAQMEVLTKKIYQNPKFYTDLYDKPANVARKKVAMRAVELMQKRDIYHSTLRSEILLSLLLDDSVAEERKILQSRLGNSNE